jgi:hypothetical protein
MVWSRVCEDEAASVEVRWRWRWRENHRAACFLSLSVSEPLLNPEAGKLSACALPYSTINRLTRTAAGGSAFASGLATL